MSEAQRLVQQIEARIGPAALLDVLRGLEELATDRAVLMEVERPRDSINVYVKSGRRHKLPKAA